MKNCIEKSCLIMTVLMLAMCHYIFFPAIVESTGGAFPKVKHGGFPVDGNTPCAGGVARGLGVDYGGNCDTAEGLYREPGTADVYQSGECLHCHELHASFNASEPPPNTGGNAGPDPYLLMFEYGTSTSYAELCWYCHENFNIGPYKGWGQWGFFQGKQRFQESSHFRSPAFEWPGPHPGEISDPNPMIWPRKNRQNHRNVDGSSNNGNTGSCLNCHTPHGIAVPGLDEWAVSSAVQTEYGKIIPRQLIAWEEGLCMRCHSKIGPADGWKDEFKYAGVREQFKNSSSKMPVVKPNLAKAKRHDRKKENVYPGGTRGALVAQGWNPTNGRHVECYDCHNPHTIWDKQTYDDPGPYRGISGSHKHKSSELEPHSNKASGVLRGIWGVALSNFGSNWSEPNANQPSFTVVDQVDKEYEVCMKCHTYFAFGSNIPRDSDGRVYTDLSKDYNPNNAAYHPALVKTGRTLNVRNIPANKNPWKEPFRNVGNQTMYCTDCHGADNGPASPGISDSSDMATTSGSSKKNQPRGPHGSDNPFILKGDWFRYNDDKSSAGSRSNSSLLCFKCHQQGAYGGGGSGDNAASSFAKNTGGNLHVFHRGITGSNLRCVRCHIQVPHGWRRRSLLIDMDGDDGTYGNPLPQYQRYINKLGGRKGYLASPANWSESNCSGKDWMSNYCESG